MVKPNSRLLLVLVILNLGWWRQQARADFLPGTPRKLGAEVNTPTRDTTPALSGDGKTLYFSSLRSGGIGTQSLWQVTRDKLDADAPWGNLKNISSLGGSFSNSPSVTEDGRELYFGEGWGCCGVGSSRPGGQGGLDIWVSKRTSVDDEWGEPENLGPLVNSGRHEDGPSISADGLSLYFGSTQPGGLGGHDIYVAKRQSRDDPWEAPVNLGPALNSQDNDYLSSLSFDGLTAFVFSNRPGASHRLGDMWVAIRSSVDEDFGTPVHFPPLVNVPSGAWDMTMSPDGSALYYGVGHGNNVDIWELPLLPFGRAQIGGNGGRYSQTFNEALGANNANEVKLPTGWTASDGQAVFHQNSTNQVFPADGVSGTEPYVFNAGADRGSDRSLAIYVPSRSKEPTLQFLAEVAESDANSFQLKFDIEVWDNVKQRNVPGEAAFDVMVHVDHGGGFEHLVDLGTVTTGPKLSLPTGEILDGNLDDNRMSFDSGLLPANISSGAALRVRWRADIDGATEGWLYGLDNVELNLFFRGDFNDDGILSLHDVDLLSAAVATGSANTAFDLNSDDLLTADDVSLLLGLANRFNGDVNFDGEVGLVDFMVLANNFDQTDKKWSEGDLDANGTVQFPDFLILANNFGQSAAATTAAVPEPCGMLLAVLGAGGLWCATRRADRSVGGRQHDGLGSRSLAGKLQRLHRPFEAD